MAQPEYGEMYCSAAEFRGRRGHDGGVFHRAVLLQQRDQTRDLATTLADRDVDAVQVFALLVQDRVNASAVLPVWRSPMINWR